MTKVCIENHTLAPIHLTTREKNGATGESMKITHTVPAGTVRNAKGGISLYMHHKADIPGKLYIEKDILNKLLGHTQIAHFFSAGKLVSKDGPKEDSMGNAEVKEAKRRVEQIKNENKRSGIDITVSSADNAPDSSRHTITLPH